LWGFQIPGESVQTERSAMCLTDARYVYYAWGKDISGPSLANALKQAGCRYAIHLDMNTRHCGFVFMHTTDITSRDAHYALADPGMAVNPSRYVLGSDKDFFYAMLRAPSFADTSGATWSPSPGSQPPPAFLPGIHEAVRLVGDLQVRIVAFDSGRIDWAVRAGTDEPAASGAHAKKTGLEASLEGRAIAAVGLGHTTDTLRYGLAFDGRCLSTFVKVTRRSSCRRAALESPPPVSGLLYRPARTQYSCRSLQTRAKSTPVRATEVRSDSAAPFASLRQVAFSWHWPSTTRATHWSPCYSTPAAPASSLSIAGHATPPSSTAPAPAKRR